MYHLLILPEVIGAFEDGNRAEGSLNLLPALRWSSLIKL